MKKERRLFIYTIFVILLLCGCSEKRKTERKEGTTIQLSKAIEIDSLSLEERNNLLILSYSVPHCDTGSANLYSNGELVQNEQYGFYARGYYQDGAQYDYMTELYSINLETSEEKKIYYTDKAYLINEMTVNNKFLYWVEYITKEEKTYYIIREFNIETQKVKTIVENVRRRIEIGFNSEFNSRRLPIRSRSNIYDCTHISEQPHILVALFGSRNYPVLKQGHDLFRLCNNRELKSQPFEL